MAKVMLVEDDNNLREIYGARLLAEGYEIVSAKDGEEALALAVKEKPDLIISDIMMPKISGFDMLDILRSTAETKNTKVIMMTALSQAEDKERADKLGADRYLVKSQVTLEDVAKAAAEVLGSDAAPAAAATAAEPTAAPEPVAEAAPVAVAEPAAPAEPAVETPAVVPTPTPAPVPTPTPVAAAPTLAADPAPAAATPATTPAAEPTSAPEERTSTITPGEGDHPQTSVHTKVISPINDLSAKPPDLQALLAKEEAKETVAAPTPEPSTTPVSTAPVDEPTPAPAPPANQAVVNDVTPPPPPPVSIAPDGTIQS